MEVPVRGRPETMVMRELSWERGHPCWRFGSEDSPALPGIDPLCGEAATAGDMTVWYLQEDRSRFEEGSLNHGENSHSDPTPAVHG